MKRYERDIEFVLNDRGKTVVLDELKSKEIQLPDSVRIINLKKESDSKLSGKLVVSNPLEKDKYSSNFIKKVNVLLKPFGVTLKKKGVGTFFYDENMVDKEKQFKASFNIQIVNEQHAFGLEKVFTNSFLSRFGKYENEFLFVGEMLDELNNTSLLYLPMISNQLTIFIFNRDERLKSYMLNSEEENEAKEMFERAKDVFKNETGFAIGDILEYGKDKNGFIKYNDSAKKAYAVANEFAKMQTEKFLFLLIRSLRNVAAHFGEIDEISDETSLMIRKFKNFINRHSGVYRETVKAMAYDFLGVEKDFNRPTGKTIEATN